MLLPTRWALFCAVVGAAGCRSGQPGASFAGASLLMPSSEAEAAHDELLRADIARADSVARRGFAEGLASNFASDVLYLRGGLPILRGALAARAVMSAESLGTNATARWQPVRAETSGDHKSGYTYGYAIYGVAQTGAPALRVDRYIAFWRKEAVGWRIAGYAETYGSPPPTMALPDVAADSVVADVPLSRQRGALEAIRGADTDFSRDATKFGTGEAFGRYAAQDAQMFSGPGEFITGPRAISESFGPPGEKSSLVWHPVEGEIAKSGDLGFTVGNAVFNGEREDGAPIVRYSKYLTVWKRQRDGSWRYVVDGGSARPAPTNHN
jgi:ketosteroid isomerase-like protein